MTRDVQKPASDVTAARVKHAMAVIGVHCAAIRGGEMDCKELTERIDAEAAALITALERGNNDAVRGMVQG